LQIGAKELPTPNLLLEMLVLTSVHFPFVHFHMEQEEPHPKVSFREVYYLHQIWINRDLT